MLVLWSLPCLIMPQNHQSHGWEGAPNCHQGLPRVPTLVLPGLAPALFQEIS
jgi:hypothetical protein